MYHQPQLALAYHPILSHVIPYDPFNISLSRIMVPQPLFHVFFSPQYAQLPVTPLTRSVVPCFSRWTSCVPCCATTLGQIEQIKWRTRAMCPGRWQDLAGIAMGIWSWYIDTHWTRITRILKLLGFSWEYDDIILSTVFWIVTNWLTIWDIIVQYDHSTSFNYDWIETRWGMVMPPWVGFFCRPR